MHREELDREKMQSLIRFHHTPFLARRRCSHAQVLFMQIMHGNAKAHGLRCIGPNAAYNRVSSCKFVPENGVLHGIECNGTSGRSAGMLRSCIVAGKCWTGLATHPILGAARRDMGHPRQGSLENVRSGSCFCEIDRIVWSFIFAY
jgi:hypothetical protein